MSTATRRLKTDKERAQHEMDLYAGRINRAEKTHADALTALNAAEDELARLRVLHEHLSRNPALLQDTLPDPDASPVVLP